MKAELRKDALHFRSTLIEQEDVKTAAEKALFGHVEKLACDVKPRVVAAYQGYKGEINILPALAHGYEQGVFAKEAFLAFPRVENKTDLSFRGFLMKELLSDDYERFFSPGYGNILEPTDECEEIDPVAIELFFVPGLAFDKQGHRLGYGRGYYDRAFNKMHDEAVRIGITYDQLLYDEIAHEDHDVPMDLVFSPSLFVVSRM